VLESPAPTFVLLADGTACSQNHIWRWDLWKMAYNLKG